jgi:hypothetical protein
VRSIEQMVKDKERKAQQPGEPQPGNVGPPPVMPDCTKASADDDGIPF